VLRQLGLPLLMLVAISLYRVISLLR
jgi:hypothetical protein